MLSLGRFLISLAPFGPILILIRQRFRVFGPLVSLGLSLGLFAGFVDPYAAI